VEDFVWRLTGKETIYQMIALAEAVESARGASRSKRWAYKKMYLDGLWQKISGRVEALRKGDVDPESIWCRDPWALLELLRIAG